MFPIQVLLRAPDGGPRNDSKAVCEQIRVISQRRLLRYRGILSAQAMAGIRRALLIALDLAEEAQIIC